MSTGGNHAGRSHAAWSASASSRLWACPGSLKLASTVDVPDRESEAAAWGTAAHEVAEDCLRNGRDAVEWVGRFVTTKSHRIEVTEELAECSQEYVDYVRRASAHDLRPLWIEQRFSLATLKPPFEAGGTADAVVHHADDGMLEVIDLKGGRGVVVEAKGNPQLRTYALGALLAFPGLDVQQVKVTIVQPRAPHPDGRIRSETFHVTDLMEWTQDLLEAMWQAKYASDDYDNLEGSHEYVVWRETYLRPGDCCRWCPASGMCPALAAKAEAEAKVWFTDESGSPQRNTPDRLMPEEIARILDHADMIQDWLNAVRSYGHAQAETGVVIPNYQLVEKHGREAWNDDADDEVEMTCVLSNVEPFVRAPNKLRTPKQIRADLKKAGFGGALDHLSGVPKTGTQLVRVDKTTREAVAPAVSTFFNALD